jgi:hypothetical protein
MVRPSIRNPVSEEASAERRAAAQKAAAARKLDPRPVKRRCVRVHAQCSFVGIKRPCARMIHGTSGRSVHVGSPQHIAAQRAERIGRYRYRN